MSVLTAANGQDLDSYCNTIDMMLHEIRENLDIDESEIPSDTQREGFIFLLRLLAWAESFTGTLRYDVCVPHESCPEHDDHMRAKIARCKEDLSV